MYVIIHELAHICDLTSEQHDEKFWNNFEWLLEHLLILEFIIILIIVKMKNHIGINITSNVLDDI